MQTLRVIGEIPSQQEYHKFTYFEAISTVKTKKNWGVVYLPSEKKQNLISYVSYELRNRPRSLWSLCGSVVENRSAEPNI